MQIVKYFKFIFFSILIILIPFLEFLSKNIDETDVILVKSFFILILIISFLFYLFVYIINYTFKQNSKYDSLLIVGISYWLFFQHNFIKLIIFKTIKFIGINEFNPNAEISFIIILLGSIFFSYLITKKNIFIKKFLSIFFIISFLASIFQIIIFNKNVNINKNSEVKLITYSDKLNSQKENIYFFILDGMQPLEDFQIYHNSDQSNFLELVKNKNYEYVYNTTNFYGNTTHSLSSLFYLDKIFDKNNLLKKKVIKFFPSILRKNESSDLIYNLNKLGYDFKWIGNFFAYCPKFNLNYCVKKDKSNIIDSYMYINFFKQTPLIQIIVKLGEFFKFNFDKYIFFKLNNGMGRLVDYLKENSEVKKNNKPTFYFIHHMSPHWPYITKSDCTYKRYAGKANMKGYKSAYLCNLKRIENTINYLSKVDPNSIVVFQADHNWEMSYISEKKYGKRNKIFNLLKINKKCNNQKNINLNNVNTARLILSCITGNNPIFLN